LDYIVFGLLLCLIFVVFQDLKLRRIHIALPALIFISSVLLFNRKPGVNYTIFVLNMMFFRLLSLLLICSLAACQKENIKEIGYFTLGYDYKKYEI
jgi:hypothetical protein